MGIVLYYLGMGMRRFRNDPHFIANAFASWLYSSEFRGCFDHVVFAVYDPSKSRNTLRAFQARFQQS